MKKIAELLKKNPLFVDMPPESLKGLAEDMMKRKKIYEQNEYLFQQGEKSSAIAMVLEGCVYVVRDDFLGNREIVTEITEGEIFDEVYALMSEEGRSVSAVAAEKSIVSFIPVDIFLNGENPATAVLIKNLLKALAKKNLLLNGKLESLSKRSIREKVISYLTRQAEKQGRMEFDIPFNRQQLADYLSVERSALSRQLAEMQEDGIIKFYKNHFVLYNEGE